MSANRRFRSRSLLAGAILLFIVALVIAATVIPVVKGDTSPRAIPERAVHAFWVNVALTLLAAMALVLIGIKSSARGGVVRVVLGALASLVLLLAVALTDAAFAFRGHGEDMQLTVILLFLCGTADLGASLLLGAAALQRS